MLKNNLWSIPFLAAVKWKSLKIRLPNTSFKMLFWKGKKAEIPQGTKTKWKQQPKRWARAKLGQQMKHSAALVESEVSLSENQGTYKDITLRVSLFERLPPRKCKKHACLDFTLGGGAQNCLELRNNRWLSLRFTDRNFPLWSSKL